MVSLVHYGIFKKYHNVFATPAFKVLHLCHLSFSQAGCDCVSQSMWRIWHYVTSGARSQVMGFHVVSWRVCSWHLLLRTQSMCEKPKPHGKAMCGLSAQPSQQSPAFKPSNPMCQMWMGKIPDGSSLQPQVMPANPVFPSKSSDLPFEPQIISWSLGFVT